MPLLRLDRPELSIDDLLSGEVSLVSPPEIYARLRRLMDDPEARSDALVQVIETDPALTARLLHVANSAFFAVPQKVDSVAHAVQLLGFREIEHLVLATEVVQRFRAIPQDLISIYSFWHESVRCAVLARQMAYQRAPCGDVNTIFVAALLHGVGRLVIYTRVPELGRKALVESRCGRLPLHEAERVVMGFDYAEVGAALAARWQLPESLCSVIGNHIQPERAAAFREEAAVVCLALAASRARSFDAEKVRAALPREPELWQLARLTPSDAEFVLPEAERAFFSALAFFG